jgi:hypothetical protein
MKTQSLVLVTLLTVGMLGCQPGGVPASVNGQTSSATTAVGIGRGATVVVSLVLPDGFTVKAPAAKVTDVRHYVARLVDSATSTPVGAALDLYPQTTGTFTGVPDGAYYVTIDAQDAANASITEGGAPARSTNSVTVAQSGTDVRYSDSATTLNVALQLRNGTGGDAVISLQQPAGLNGQNLYGLSMIGPTGSYSGRQRGDTAQVTINGLVDGTHSLWSFARDGASKGTIASPNSVVVAGETTTSGRTPNLAFPSVITTAAEPATGLTDMRQIAAAPNGDLYMADNDGNRILKRDAATGTITTVVGNGTAHDGNDELATNAVLKNPSGIAVDNAGNLFIADSGNSRLKMVPAADGKYFGSPTTMTAGNIYRLNGNVKPNIDSVATDSVGNVYYNNGTGLFMLVRVDGNYFDSNTPKNAGTAYDLRVDASVRPSGMTVDRWGNLFVTSNNRVSMLVNTTGHYFEANPAAVRTASTSNNPTVVNLLQGSLNNASGVAVDGAGNLYISEAGTHKVTMLERYQGNAFSVVGTGSATDSFTNGDGGAAFAAKIKAPFGLAMTQTGRLFLSAQDPANGNHYRLRMVN